MDQEVQVITSETQTPESALLLTRFGNLNLFIIELCDDIAFQINAIKQYPKPSLTNPVQGEAEAEDVLSKLNRHLNRLESSKHRLEEIRNHLKTIV